MTTILQILTSIFTAEALLKMFALTPAKYFKNGWNVFDIIVVVISLAELGLASKKMSVLRSFRLVSSKKRRVSNKTAVSEILASLL